MHKFIPRDYGLGAPLARLPYQQFAAVVDGTSSGSLLAPALRARGYNVVHVQSSDDWHAPAMKSFEPDHYDHLLVHRGDAYHLDRQSPSVVELALQLKRFSPCAVFAGAESGVVLADHLSEMLELKTNGTSLSQARRNKSLMAQRLADAGVRVAKFVRAKSSDEILAWRDKNSIGWPIFLKPETSGGTKGICACLSDGDIIKAFDAIYGKPNAYGITDEAVFAQEYMAGDEYALNTVSIDGRHETTGIWKYVRTLVEGGATVWNCDAIMPTTEPVCQRLIGYGIRVLNALGVKNGPAHTEIKITPRGPRLVEMGARLYGSRLPELEGLATDRSPVELAIDALLRPELLTPRSGGYELLRHALVVTLHTQEEGRITHDNLGQVRALPGYVDEFFPEDGTPVAPARAGIGFGEVWLLHPESGVVERSMNELRGMEAKGAFIKKPS